MRFNLVVASLLGVASGSPTLGGLRASKTENHLVARQSRPTSYPANTIDQPIDHFPDSPRYAPHTNDTFKQRYFFDDTYYKTGGPVFLYIGGETSGESRFSNLETGIIQILMQAFNGLGVILENRYYGQSLPFGNSSTTDDLAYLSNEQTIADNAYFAQHATFPGVPGNLTAPGTPWILYGGSLAGAETAFSVVTYGGTGEKILYGGIGSSGVIHAVYAYPEWYDPIQKFGPQDCIARINNIVDKVDMLVEANNTAAVGQLKQLFGLQDLEDIRDFVYTIALPVGGPMNYPLGTWQELNWNETVSDPHFWWFCGNVTNDDAPKNITQNDSALANYTNGESWPGLGGYANYFQQNYLPLCLSGNYGSSDDGCFGVSNESSLANTTTTTARAYLYSTCTELGAYQAAQPLGRPSLLSRQIQPDYTQRWCNWAFPPGRYNSIDPNGPNLTYYDSYGDLNITAMNLALIDGSADVWNGVDYHSPDAGNRYPSVNPSGINEYFINGAGHHWDSYGILDVEAEPDMIREAHLWEIRTVGKWLDAWTVS
ncbi:uncharacterized protein HMPREF1541_10135 [Cyphellophora europaea CBS 101466]|uniref:Extracelular serine carboxypeptidase n=1 Tax=Cyphellophora europaea (strain CBS 101466) TaxID=1220924 RepID=W2S767_CYPE1|nr:uncharacterized protein HMPREF1541_10135 [Cyphellophora europaea CBS 101466]ETN44465.1 hypothetical protein HMPREF1541_10135 [Cyphellophora europaea CBS 101466]